MILIGIGGILGTLARYYLGKWITSKTDVPFPWGTWVINLSGSFLLGLLFGWHSDSLIPFWIWSLLGIGFCGAYTTFSTFGLETIDLLKNKQTLRALVYVASSVVFGLLCAWLGLLIVSEIPPGLHN